MITSLLCIHRSASTAQLTAALTQNRTFVGISEPVKNGRWFMEYSDLTLSALKPTAGPLEKHDD